MRSSHFAAVCLFLIAGALGAAAIAQTLPPRGAGATPPAPPPARAAQTPAVAGSRERGRYIVEEIAHCVECHSPRDERGNIIDSQRYEGGPVPIRPPWPNDWAIFAPPNKGLATYDDALAMRLLTQGSIGRDGAPLRPPMPRFHMTRQDAADVIAYMRSLK